MQCFKKKPGKEAEGLRAPLVGAVVIDIFQSKTAELRQDNLPVAKRMADFIEQFLKGRVQPVELFDHLEQHQQTRVR